MANPFYQTHLRIELERRQARNSRYSLRTFARDLKVDPGTLSRVLKGDRPLSPRLAKKILPQLKLGTSQSKRFLESLFEHVLENSQTLDLPVPVAVAPVANELFRIIGNWYYSAILELTYVRDFRAEPAWISKAIGISPTLARQAVQRLLEAGLLRWNGARLEKTMRSTTSGNKTKTSLHLRRHTVQMFQKAIRSFTQVPIEERSSTGMTFAIDPAGLPLARKLIEEFTNEMVRTLESNRPTRVYHLAIALFPLSESVS